MEILLLSCYELGHQPMALAWPLASLARAGYPVKAVDLAVDSFPVAAVRQADFVGISVPMHTALRLGAQAAARVRRLNSAAHICFYGSYAWMNAGSLFDQGLTDSAIAGEYETPLTALVDALAKGKALEAIPGVTTREDRSPAPLARQKYPLPLRDPLPALDRYARFTQNGTTSLAGYTETSRGCLHTCHHCPVVPVYKGRFFVVPVETVLADIRQQVASGARHISFGDPDFLNGPGHAMRVAQALHEAFPQVTFDFTTKVEHILEHRPLLNQLRALGAAFLISAFESLSDTVLARLDKGHTAADLEVAMAILADAGLPVRPTWVPFTPWTMLEDYLEMLTWIRTHELVFHVPAVQLSIRLLIPPHSALLKQPDTASWLGPLDTENFSYRWDHPDSRMDTLQREVTALAETMGDANPFETFVTIERAAYALAGKAAPVWTLPECLPPAPPRLTEDWFC